MGGRATGTQWQSGTSRLVVPRPAPQLLLLCVGDGAAHVIADDLRHRAPLRQRPAKGDVLGNKPPQNARPSRTSRRDHRPNARLQPIKRHRPTTTRLLPAPHRGPRRPVARAPPSSRHTSGACRCYKRSSRKQNRYASASTPLKTIPMLSEMYHRKLPLQHSFLSHQHSFLRLSHNNYPWGQAANTWALPIKAARQPAST